MKCIYCDKKIKNNELHTRLGLYRNFIYIKCLPEWEKQCMWFINITDSEFKDWMVGV